MHCAVPTRVAALAAGEALNMVDHEQSSGEQAQAEIAQATKPRDADIQIAVVHILFDDPWLDASSIQVSVYEGIVTLRGLVDAFDQLRRAEELVGRVDGVRGIRNILRVGAS